jgi:hypothetical protein
MRSCYSHWLEAGRLSGRSSSPTRVKNFLFSTTSRLAVGPTEPPIQLVLEGLSPGVKRLGCEACEFSRLEPLLFLSSSSSIVLTRLSGPRSKNQVLPGIEPAPQGL